MRRKRDYPSRVSDLDPAPGDLRLVQAFVNTADFEHGTDELGSPRELAEWLTRHSLAVAGMKLDQTAFEWAIDAREALRAALEVNRVGIAGKAAAEKAAKVGSRLDRIAMRSPAVVRFSAQAETRFEPGADTIDGALGRLFTIVAEAQATGAWKRLKACADADCRAAFYDLSKSRTGKWCSMRRCGNRINSRRCYRIRDLVRDRRRRRDEEEPEPDF